MEIRSGGTRSRPPQVRLEPPSAALPADPAALLSASPVRSKTVDLPLDSPSNALGPFQQFFATASVPCPYVPGRAERKLIVELAGRGAPGFYDALSRAGFRRSHRFAYRPACRACTACVPVRIAVAGFAPTRSIRRVRNAHAGLAATLLAPRATIEQFRLFMAYQHSRHWDSEM